MPGTGIFDVLCHLHRQFDIRVRAAGYAPGLGAVIVALAEQGLEIQEVVFDGKVIFPTQKQHRNTVVL